MNRRCFPGCAGADERLAGRRGGGARYRRGACQGGGGSGQGSGPPSGVGGGGSSGMVVAEAARRGKRLGEVHGLAAAAVEFVDLGAAAESAGEDHRAWRGFPEPGQQGALGAGSAHLAVADLEAKVAGEAAAAGLQVPGLGAGAASSFCSASQPSTAYWWQCT